MVQWVKPLYGAGSTVDAVLCTVEIAVEITVLRITVRLAWKEVTEELHCIGVDSIGIDGTEVNWIGLDWMRLDGNGLNRIGWDWMGLNWMRLDWTG